MFDTMGYIVQISLSIARVTTPHTACLDAGSPSQARVFKLCCCCCGKLQKDLFAWSTNSSSLSNRFASSSKSPPLSSVVRHAPHRKVEEENTTRVSLVAWDGRNGVDNESRRIRHSAIANMPTLSQTLSSSLTTTTTSWWWKAAGL